MYPAERRALCAGSAGFSGIKPRKRGDAAALGPYRISPDGPILIGPCPMAIQERCVPTNLKRRNGEWEKEDIC